MIPEQMQKKIEEQEAMLEFVQHRLDGALVALSFALKGNKWEVPADQAGVICGVQRDAIAACALHTLISVLESVALHRSTVTADNPSQAGASVPAGLADRIRDLKASCGPADWNASLNP